VKASGFVGLIVSLVAVVTAALAAAGTADLDSIAAFTTRLDVDRAGRTLAELDSREPAVAIERARWALYRGDCVTANTVLSAPRVVQRPESRVMAQVARGCAGATAEAVVVEDRRLGVWVRVQDDADRVLVPLIADVAARARTAVARDLGVDLPRPLRVDLVRDQYSLSMVSGLPIQAAQTTGTVAVARWGRVIMVTPRAAAMGYPWQDTLAHEITHLALSRASGDKAPLWLQEGIAKREEVRWRPTRPLDDRARHTEQARAALLAGEDVGVDRLGPSIAMLPTPEAASTAYAEVASFVEYWITQNGWPALELLLLDLSSMPASDGEPALRSVTGWGLQSWIHRWKQHLTSMDPPARGASPPSASPSRELAREVRLGDLLLEAAFPAAAVVPLSSAVARAPERAAVRHRLAEARLRTRQLARAGDALGELESLDGLHAGWLGASGQAYLLQGRVEDAVRRFDLALGIQPLWERAACGRLEAVSGGGRLSVPRGRAGHALCEEARAHCQR
jgi:hypothetical protein